MNNYKSYSRTNIGFDILIFSKIWVCSEGDQQFWSNVYKSWYRDTYILNPITVKFDFTCHHHINSLRQGHLPYSSASCFIIKTKPISLMQDSWTEAKVILELSIGRHLTEQLVFGYQPARVHLQFVGLSNPHILPKSSMILTNRQILTIWWRESMVSCSIQWSACLGEKCWQWRFQL